MEKIEITDEMIDDALRCDMSACGQCSLHKVRGNCKDNLARALKSERAERAKNPGVWTNAPDIAEKACVIFTHGKQDIHCPKYEIYTRKLPKTKEREIAEEKAHEFPCGLFGRDGYNRLADIIEAAILEAQGNPS